MSALFRRAGVRVRAETGAEGEGGDSDYIAMTDMMVGVLFIFIIMLCFFALQYKQTTAALTGAKDTQTAALLQTAGVLKPEAVQAEIDRTAHIVCLPGHVLGDDGPGDSRHCFAYSATTQTPPKPTDTKAQIAAADQAGFMSNIESELKDTPVPANVSIDAGNLSFPADTLFAPGTATLTPQGQATAARVADILAARLPCYGYGVPASGCGNEAHMAAVNVQVDAQFDAFTAEGRAAAALALQRSVVFHDALTSAKPVLGQVRNQPQPGSDPLLRVSSYQQSTTNAGSQMLSIQFHMGS
jgi:flagellar motor protein MotB